MAKRRTAKRRAVSRSARVRGRTPEALAIRTATTLLRRALPRAECILIDLSGREPRVVAI